MWRKQQGTKATHPSTHPIRSVRVALDREQKPETVTMTRASYFAARKRILTKPKSSFFPIERRLHSVVPGAYRGECRSQRRAPHPTLPHPTFPAVSIRSVTTSGLLPPPHPRGRYPRTRRSEEARDSEPKRHHSPHSLSHPLDTRWSPPLPAPHTTHSPLTLATNLLHSSK